jgi:aspartyl-tRNA(Asn)/glutamyl-tRNA(Gln) amidotransferase subunit A
VRVPAAWNDLVGLKTTHGLLPLDGVVPLCPRFDTIGPIVRSVEDAALLLAAIGGQPAPDLAEPPSSLSLFVLEDPEIGPNRDATQAAFEAALGRIAAAGARLGRGALPGAGASLPLAPCVFTAEAYGVWRQAIEASPDRMFAAVRDRFRLGAAFSAADYVDAWRQLDAHRAAYAAATAGYDAVLMPTTANLPPDVARLLAEPEHFAEENLLTLRNTRIANLLGLCALTLPTGTPHCGMMVMAAPGSEARLLRIGAALERALG